MCYNREKTKRSRNQIPPRLASRIQLALEEAVQTLLPGMSIPRMQASCEYSEASESASWTIEYSGPELSPGAERNELAYQVLQGITGEMHHTYDVGAEYPNRLTLTLKTD